MYTYAARLVRVIDGDTVVLDLDLGFKLWRLNESYRLARIDAPEMATAGGPPAKAALEDYLAGKALKVVTSKGDKYGRYLVELLADNANANDWLVTNGRAVYRSY